MKASRRYVTSGRREARFVPHRRDVLPSILTGRVARHETSLAKLVDTVYERTGAVSAASAPRERPADQREEEIAEGHRRRLADAELGAVDEAKESEHGARQRIDGRAMEVTVDDEGSYRAQDHPGQNCAAAQQLHAAVDDAGAGERRQPHLLCAGARRVQRAIHLHLSP